MSKAQANTEKQLKKKKNNGSGGSMVRSLVDRIEPFVEDALPDTIGKERFLNVCLTTLRKNPDLMDCSQKSLLGALVQSAQLGLTPNLLGEAYVVPYGNEANFQIGYKGMIELCRRSGELSSIKSKIIYENDDYEIDFSSSKEVKSHQPWWTTDADESGEIFAAYCMATMTNGGEHCEIMHISELKEHKKRHVDGSLSMPFDAWCKKTVIRQAFKYLPVSTEAKEAEQVDESTVMLDETAPAQGTPDLTVENGKEINTDTGEVVADANAEESASNSPVDPSEWKESKEAAKEKARQLNELDNVNIDLRLGHEKLIGKIQSAILEQKESSPGKDQEANDEELFE